MTTAIILTALIAYLWIKSNRFAQINKEIYRKAAMLTVLITLTFTGSAQFINLDWPKTNVKYQNRDLDVIYTGKDCIEYKTETGYIGYEFTDRICTASYICIDSIAGDSLIRSHEFKNWQPVSPDKWLYYAGYDDPVKVSADWRGGTVIFRYSLFTY